MVLVSVAFLCLCSSLLLVSSFLLCSRFSLGVSLYSPSSSASCFVHLFSASGLFFLEMKERRWWWCRFSLVVLLFLLVFFLFSCSVFLPLCWVLFCLFFFLCFHAPFFFSVFVFLLSVPLFFFFQFFPQSFFSCFFSSSFSSVPLLISLFFLASPPCFSSSSPPCDLSFSGFYSQRTMPFLPTIDCRRNGGGGRPLKKMNSASPQTAPFWC